MIYNNFISVHRYHP